MLRGLNNFEFLFTKLIFCRRSLWSYRWMVRTFGSKSERFAQNNCDTEHRWHWWSYNCLPWYSSKYSFCNILFIQYLNLNNVQDFHGQSTSTFQSVKSKNIIDYLKSMWNLYFGSHQGRPKKVGLTNRKSVLNRIVFHEVSLAWPSSSIQPAWHFPAFSFS